MATLNTPPEKGHQMARALRTTSELDPKKFDSSDPAFSKPTRTDTNQIIEILVEIRDALQRIEQTLKHEERK